MADTPSIESIVDRCRLYDTGIHVSRECDIYNTFKLDDDIKRFMTWDEMRVMPEYEWQRGAHAHVKVLCGELLGGKLQHEDIFLSYAANTIRNFVYHPYADAPSLCDLVLIRDTLLCHYPGHDVTQAAKDAVPYSRKVIFNEPQAS